MSDVRPQDIRHAAMDLLARREHLYRELEQKLTRRFPAPQLITEILDHLLEQNLQSDQRFVASYIRQRSAKGYGPDRIRQELRQKGAAGDLVNEEMRESEADWFTLARNARVKRFGDALPKDISDKSKQLRFLQYRGFSGDYAGAALDD